MERTKLSRLLALLLAATAYAWAVAACPAPENRAYLALETGVSQNRAEEIFSQEEDPVGCCFFGQEEGQWVSCPATGKTSQVTRLYLAGNGELMDAGRLSWQDGCLIDPQTAQNLFGTKVCGGQVLSWQGKLYQVLDTLPAQRPTLVIRAGGEDAMNRCVLAAAPKAGNVAGAAFLARFDLKGKVLDFFPLWALARNCLLLAPAVMIGLLCGRKRLLALALMGLLLWRGAVIPPEMIPSRWSDFSFWSRMWQGQRENLQTILLTPLEEKQLQMLLNMVKSMGCSILAAFLAGGAVRRRQYADTVDRGR